MPSRSVSSAERSCRGIRAGASTRELDDQSNRGSMANGICSLLPHVERVICAERGSMKAERRCGTKDRPARISTTAEDLSQSAPCRGAFPKILRTSMHRNKGGVDRSPKTTRKAKALGTFTHTERGLRQGRRNCRRHRAS